MRQAAWIALGRDAPPQQLPDLERAVRGRHGDGGQQVGVGERLHLGLGGVGVEAQRPCSSERNAFCRLSGNVRPIAIASPTDCIWVPRIPVVPGSFSNAQRGIFVTT